TPLPGAVEIDGHGFSVLIPRLHERRERFGQLLLQLRIIERQSADRRQLDGADRSAREEVECRHHQRISDASRLATAFDAEDGARESLLTDVHRDLRATQLIEEVSEARVARNVDLEALERSRKRRLR